MEHMRLRMHIQSELYKEEQCSKANPVTQTNKQYAVDIVHMKSL